MMVDFHSSQMETERSLAEALKRIRYLELQVSTAAASGLTYTTISLSTVDLTGSTNTCYTIDLSGLTATRNITLPTATAGDRFIINISAGHGTYALIVKGAATVTINNKAAATEWSRLFITDEFVELIATSATNWQVVEDGRKPCVVVFTRITSAANTVHLAATDVKADWNNLETDIGSTGDLTNDRINIRRVAYWKFTGAYAAAAAIADQKYFNVVIYKNGTGGTRIQSVAARQSAAGSSSIAGVSLSPKPHLCAVGDYVEYYFKTEDANMGLLNTDYAGGGSAILAGIVFFAGEEILER